jgi:hypothetical protein
MSESDNFLIDFCHKRSESTTAPIPDISTTIPAQSSSIVGNYEVTVISTQDLIQTMPECTIKIVYHLAGSTTNAVSKSICEGCKSFLSKDNLPDDHKKVASYTAALNRGGLKQPCQQAFKLIINLENYFLKYKNILMRNGSTPARDLKKKFPSEFPPCCNVKDLMIDHYFKIRNYCIENFTKCSKRKAIFSTSSAAKRQKKQ